MTAHVDIIPIYIIIQTVLLIQQTEKTYPLVTFEQNIITVRNKNLHIQLHAALNNKLGNKTVIHVWVGAYGYHQNFCAQTVCNVNIFCRQKIKLL